MVNVRPYSLTLWIQFSLPNREDTLGGMRIAPMTQLLPGTEAFWGLNRENFRGI